MSLELVSLLVYTVGVKCRGLNKKETYEVSHIFSLSERTANKVLKQSMYDLIKHNRTHVVRVYPDGMRIGSTNYEPVKYWGAGCQLVSLNWQTFGESPVSGRRFGEEADDTLKIWDIRSTMRCFNGIRKRYMYSNLRR